MSIIHVISLKPRDVTLMLSVRELVTDKVKRVPFDTQLPYFGIHYFSLEFVLWVL